METDDRRSWPVLTNVEGVLHTVEAVVDSRWLEFKSPPRAGWR
jgi:C4-type Zn-finger protein